MAGTRSTDKQRNVSSNAIGGTESANCMGRCQISNLNLIHGFPRVSSNSSYKNCMKVMELYVPSVNEAQHVK